MKFEQYCLDVQRTCPTLPEYNGNPIILDSLHMVVGMFGEIYEVNSATSKANLREEITDMFWYACNYANKRKIIINNPLQFKGYVTGVSNAGILSILEVIQREYINIVSELQDYDKKEFAYGKEETPIIALRREGLINEVIRLLGQLYYYNEFNCEEAMQQNIDKLRSRFPDKFDAEKAINRNHEEESKHLGN